VDISYAEDPEDIAAEVLQVEHKLLPFVIKKFSENKIVFENGRVKVLL
jgi:folate-dependent phosphoribosylglycinamide formyltransferase PurN